MVLLLRNHEMRGLLPLAAYVEAVEEGYRALGRGRGVNIPRQNHWIAGDASRSVGGGHLPPGSRASFKYKGAFLPDMGGAGIQAYTAGLPDGLETYMFLYSTETGALLAVMEVLYYDWLKTAAVGAVAARHMAPAGSAVVALFGTGRHARSQLHGLCAVRPIRRVQAYSRRREPREAFSRRLTEELGIDVMPVDSPAAALQGADIVVTITTSGEPVFDAADLPERPLHINAMGAHYPWVREIAPNVVTRCRIVVDEWAQGLMEQGEIVPLIDDGRLTIDDLAGDLGGVVAGDVVGRGPDDRWTLFLSGGTGVEDVAVSTRLYEAAVAQEAGTRFAFNQPYEFEF